MPTVVSRSARPDRSTARRSSPQGRRIDLVYRRVLINDIVARPDECAALVRAYEARRVAVANTFRCKIPHKKAFFAVLTDEVNAALFSARRARADSRARAVDAPARASGRRRMTGADVDLVAARARPSRAVRHQAERRIRRRRRGVGLGDDRAAAGTARSSTCSPIRMRHGFVQERIAVRREVFPMHEAGHGLQMRDMLVDLAPYLFRGRLAGFLTRLSATGLANVTSGGGQVPSFLISRSERLTFEVVSAAEPVEGRRVDVSHGAMRYSDSRLRRRRCRSEPGAQQRRRDVSWRPAGERVALIADEASGERRGEPGRGARPMRGADWQGVLVEDVAQRPMRRAPPAVLEALEWADAGILCVQPQRRRAAARGWRSSRSSSGGRSATRTWSASRRRSCAGDAHRLSSRSMRCATRCAGACTRARTLRVRTPPGTDFIATFNPSLAWVKTSGLISPRYWSNLPAGEVFTTPAQRRRHVRVRRDGRRLLRAEVRRSSSRRRMRLRHRGRPARRPPSARGGSRARVLGLLRTPTTTAIASASWRSAPTSASAR